MTLALTLLAAAGVVQAQSPGIQAADASTPTTLYLHVVDASRDIPMNTQQPPAHFARTTTFGPLVTTMTCLDGPTMGVGGGATGQNFATSYAYVTPAPVEYGDVDASGDPRTHPERGLAYDAQLDAAAPSSFTWYFAVGKSEGQDVAPPPVAIPNLQMRVTARAGDHLSVDDAAYNEGPILFEGTTPPVTVVGDEVLAGPAGSEGVTALGQIDGAWIYELTATLDIAQDQIPRATGMNVRIDLYSDLDACDPDEGTLLLASPGVFTADGLRPRLELAVLNPLRVEYLHPEFIGEDLVVHTAVNSVWGHYDLDLAGLTLELEVPGADVQRMPVTYRTHEHGGGTYGPADVTWVWPNATREVDGPLTGTFTVRNAAGTAMLQATFAFEAPAARESPAPAAALLAVGLLALAGLRRR